MQVSGLQRHAFMNHVLYLVSSNHQVMTALSVLVQYKEIDPKHPAQVLLKISRTNTLGTQQNHGVSLPASSRVDSSVAPTWAPRVAASEVPSPSTVSPVD